MSSLSREPVSCFSVEFGVPGFDETTYAKDVAERFHARHVVDKVDPEDLLSLDGWSRPMTSHSVIALRFRRPASVLPLASM